MASGARCDGESQRPDPSYHPGEARPDLSIVVEFAWGTDPADMRMLLEDIEHYGGPYQLETILVVDGLADGRGAEACMDLERDGVVVLAAQGAPRQHRDNTALERRMAGIGAAHADYVVTFDANVRIPNPTVLLNWCVHALLHGAAAAYPQVGRRASDADLSGRTSISDLLCRWLDRVVLRGPPARRNNYAARRDTLLDFHELCLRGQDEGLGAMLERAGRRVACATVGEVQVLIPSPVARTTSSSDRR